MRYPEFLKDGGTIGFVAPSFGCNIEPYRSAFDNALKRFREMGYGTVLGPNCYEGSGLGISNRPEICGKELNDMYTSDEADVIISCGGGELMCEVLPYIDWEKIAASRPKWYLGYSDNTNFTYLSTILADTAAMYGPCAPSFGMEPLSESLKDAFSLLTGRTGEVHNYDKWEKESLKDEEHPYAAYNLTEPFKMKTFLPYNNVSNNVNSDGDKNAAGFSYREADGEEVLLEGRLLGGCVDCLVNLLGTRFDKTSDFLERYKNDGFVWFLESCDLNPMSIRRAFFQMKEAGWFKYVKGFLIGRPLHFGEEMMGVDQYNAVTDILAPLGVPVIMDLDIGHLPPQMPIISGAMCEVKAADNKISIIYRYK